jgi:hypothetical protein
MVVFLFITPLFEGIVKGSESIVSPKGVDLRVLFPEPFGNYQRDDAGVKGFPLKRIRLNTVKECSIYAISFLSIETFQDCLVLRQKNNKRNKCEFVFIEKNWFKVGEIRICHEE